MLMETIRAEKVTKAFGRTYALKEITLTIATGEFVGLFGPNGAGKSTFLRICAALIRPTAGRLLVRGKDVWKNLTMRGEIGFLSHAIGLYPNLTVTENLLYFAKLSALKDPVRRVDEVIDKLDMATYAGMEVGRLSRGWQQRAAIARGLLNDPQILLWDEPFTGLDEIATRMILGLLDDFRAQGRSAIISSHDFSRTMEVCGRAIMIDRGRIEYDGAGVDVADAYRRIMSVRAGTSTAETA